MTVIDNTNFAKILDSINQNEQNSYVLDLQFDKPLTTSQLESLKVTLTKNKNCSCFSLSACKSSRLELLEIFRDLNLGGSLHLQMKNNLVITEQELETINEIVTNPNNFIYSLYLSIPEGKETTVYDALALNSHLEEICLFGSDEENSLFIGKKLSNRNICLKEMRNWLLNGDLGAPLPSVKPLSLYPDAYQLHVGLDAFSAPLTSEGKQQLFQILIESYSRPVLQEIASLGLANFLFLNPDLFNTSEQKNAQKKLILYFLKDLYIEDHDSHLSIILLSTLLSCVQELNSIDNMQKFREGKTILLDYHQIKEIAAKAQTTLEETKLPYEYELFFAILANDDYHPILINYLLQCPAFIRQLKKDFPSLEDFYIWETCLLENESIKLINLPNSVDEEYLKVNRCEDLAAELRAVSPLIPIGTIDHLETVQKCISENKKGLHKSSVSQFSIFKPDGPDGSSSLSPVDDLQSENQQSGKNST